MSAGREYEIQTGMAKAVFDDKYSRIKEDGSFQSWVERVSEVVRGNFALLDGVDATIPHVEADEIRTLELARAGVLPFSGRHLQHGDENQAEKLGESFTNCSSAMFSFIKFWLLLKGSGVGRSYDSEICRVDWRNVPHCYFVLEGPDQWGNGGHPDYEDWIVSRQEAQHMFGSESEMVRWFTVGDSAEGWTKVVEIMETAAWQEKHADKTFIFDLTGVRGKGAPIAGQQGRPASGPVPFIKALSRIVGLKGLDMKPWKQALFVDHYLAASVAVGGVRRAARIGVKFWKDEGIFDYITIKRGGNLKSANLSVGVDREFWDEVESEQFNHAKMVYFAITSSIYMDGTGEPAFINLDRLTWSMDGVDEITAENYIDSAYDKGCLNLHRRTRDMIASHLDVAKRMRYPMLVNPCGEVILPVWGGYCLLADVCMKNAETLDEIRDAVRLAVQFIMRCNTMKFLYKAEVTRSNRLGVSMIGWHEAAWKFFSLTWDDLVSCDEGDPSGFWAFISELNQIATDEAHRYADLLGLPFPHMITSLKPSGTVSKVMSCTEGAHLPAFRHMIRWVQYPKGGARHLEYEAKGYPVKDVSHSYHGHVVVGFPTKFEIAEDMGAACVIASEASIEQQYEYLRRIERNWFGEGANGQVSYTLKYNPAEVSIEGFRKVVRENQPTIRCCTFQEDFTDLDASAYPYLPEERVTAEEWYQIVEQIGDERYLEYTSADVECSGGACPIALSTNKSYRENL